MRKFFGLLLCVILVQVMQAQVVLTNPIFPDQNATVTVTFDASKGNKALMGTTGAVYAHTGVITNASTSPSDWKYVQGNWGTADAKVLMTSIGNNKYTLTYNIKTFYAIPTNITVLRLAFVFRNATGNVVGRDTDGSDIYYDVYPNDGQLRCRFFEPSVTSQIVSTGAGIPVFAAASQSGTLTVTDNGAPVLSASGTTLTGNMVANGPGTHQVIFSASTGTATAYDTFTYTVPAAVVTQEPPAGTLLGATEISGSHIRLMFYAPQKSTVYVIGDFNDWSIDGAYLMKRSADASRWWLDIEGLTPGQVYRYQYVVDGNIVVADPLSTLILDPSNDGAISGSVFPNMPTYPTGKTSGHVSVIQPGKQPYIWQVNNSTRPEKTDMIVYELLMRDFLAAHSFTALKDTLDYLERLGVNVIELMPVSEFENNNSWGYNVIYHMALDKYYGSPELFKAFIDEAHKRNMAVVLDVVYNHTFGQSPHARLYWDSANNRPAANNPWLNPIAKHPFNVGNDFNHESQATKDYVIRTLKYWLTEYKVDGFRFDLSKGFTQKQNTDVGLWGQYDASRIDILKKYADEVWATTPGAYVILEHFADNSEETVLANYGMMLWGNTNHNYNEASMGYTSNSMAGVSHRNRNWNVPHLIGYMESHDEERLMYKNLTFGNVSGSYSVKNLSTALKRQELVNAFFLTVPGPKMIWQFGELGYDYSINHCTNGTVNTNCRLDPKPIRWDYLANADRKHLFEVVRALIHLRNSEQVFKTGTYNINELGQAARKAFHLSSPDFNVTILGNFGVTPTAITPAFQHTGTWYDYLTGQTIQVSNPSATINLAEGEYRIFTDKKVLLPEGSGLTTSTFDQSTGTEQLIVYPNPATEHLFVSFSLREISHLTISLFDVNGRRVGQRVDARFAEGDHTHQLHIGDLPTGLYFVQLQTEQGVAVQKVVVE